MRVSYLICNIERINISSDIQTMLLEIKLCSYLKLYVKKYITHDMNLQFRMHDYHNTLINTVLIK
jgi:hypothetical protein